MTGIHRLLASLVPGRRGEWLLAHGAELEALQGRLARLRWMAGLLSLFLRAIGAQLLADPRSFLGGALARSAVWMLSPILLMAGLGLAVLALSTDPLEVGLFATVLVLQGGFTLLALSRRSLAAPGRLLQLAGSVAAALVGLAGFVSTLGRNFDPANPDPEYAPLTILLLIGTHGLLSVIAFTGRRGDVATRGG
ncbi:MAG: hypothetical protein EHM57_03630 [Actinobacteria bacterium]|nr:MAG: hypothetical protein EHM57_03630 [Actinomycetota bacterium]